MGLLVFYLLQFVFVTLTFFNLTFVLVVTMFATVTTGECTPETVVMGHHFPIFGMLLSLHLQHTITAEVAVRGMTRSQLVIEVLTVDEWGCTCFMFDRIHGAQLTPFFTTTVVGVSGIFRPFPSATFRGRGTTSTQVFLEEFLHARIILSVKCQLDQQVHKVVVPVGPTLPLRGSTCSDLTHEPQVGLCGSI